ncbi:dihydrolipoyl dehydrogenase family protein [Sneathiella aquimaris]|uniref:dihydrolipoyl dehydrogenase family protein n=1 Tax=Sneathiella aquimaris TaxID=2599305 RepID=UPI00146DF22F|nr:NAD(P)/FAD-dependent oxidoreductase [Sneathiella aquimaris]
MMKKYDIIIIGGGNAGFGVSTVAHDANKKIAFIEERDFGGTCPNRGCTPKKVLVAAANSLHEIEMARVHEIEVGNVKLNWAKLIQREKNMIGFIPNAMEGVAKRRGDVYFGSAKFVGPNSVEVDGEILFADDIVIATGSKTRPLSIPGSELTITSDDVLSQEYQPEEVIFIGGGVIAMEFGHIYARAGTKVTILEAMPQLLPRIDHGAVAAILQESERIGITIKTGVSVTEIKKNEDKLSVVYKHEGEKLTLSANQVVNGAGRIANVDTLDLEAANIAHDQIAIKTDSFLRSTTNPSIWVCGDCLVTSPQLSPIATYEGKVVGNNIVYGPTQTPDYEIIPTSVYTIPAVSSVGLTEKDAVEDGLDVKINTHDMTDWFSSKSYAETVAWAKVIVEAKSDRILGAHLVGHKGEELIHLFSFAIRHGITATQMKEEMFAYPTFSSDIKNLL